MKMNALTIGGIILLILGVLALLGVGIPGQETVSAGPVSATFETERQIHPAISGALVALGIVGIVMGIKKA